MEPIKMYECSGEFLKNSGHFIVKVSLTKIEDKKGKKDTYRMRDFYNISTEKTKAVVGVLKRKSGRAEGLCGKAQNYTKPFIFKLEDLVDFDKPQPLDILTINRIVFIVLHEEDLKRDKLKNFRGKLDLIFSRGTENDEWKKKLPFSCDKENKNPMLPATSGGGILVGV